MAYYQHEQRYKDELSEQILRHQDLERGLNRMEDRQQQTRSADPGPILAHVVMEECREAKIRKQNRQIMISVGTTIGLIIAVIWFVASR